MKKVVIGLSGVSCSGKSTLSKLLYAAFPWSDAVVHQDNYYHPADSKKHQIIPELNHANWDCKSAVDFPQMTKDVTNIMKQTDSVFNMKPGAKPTKFFENSAFVEKHLPHPDQVNSSISQFSHIPIIILEGHIIFDHKPFYDMCDIRYFLTLDEEECKERRKKTNYDPPNPKGYFETCVWPTYLEKLRQVKKLKGISYIDAKQVPLHLIFEKMFDGISSHLEQYCTEKKPASGSKSDEDEKKTTV